MNKELENYIMLLEMWNSIFTILLSLDPLILNSSITMVDSGEDSYS